MTRDDIRKLIGGYATGSLTEAERKLLFEAALDDQELFDELAHEQSLKELIEEPGARERLIAALDGRKSAPAWWKQTWAWAAMATLALGMVVLISVVPHGQPKPAEVALAPQEKSPPPATAPPAANAPVVKQRANSVSAPRPVKERAEEKRVEETGRAEEKDAKRRDEAGGETKVKPAEPAAPPIAAPVAGATGSVGAPAAAPSAQQAATPSPRVQQQAQENAQRPFRSQVGAAMKAAPFALTYRIEPDGYVTVTVAGDGYLRVETPTPELIANNLRVTNGSTTRLKIPDGAQELTITFAAALASAKNEVATGRLAGAGGQLTDRLALKKDQLSGTIEDPAPSPNSRLAVTVRLH